jgi:hypothetical protein
MFKMVGRRMRRIRHLWFGGRARGLVILCPLKRRLPGKWAAFNLLAKLYRHGIATVDRRTTAC